MKTIISIFIFFSAFSCNAQRLDIKTITGTQYLVKQDTSINGVITITKSPLSEVAKELESQYNSIDGAILTIENQLTDLQAQRKELLYQRSQVIGLQTKLGFR